LNKIQPKNKLPFFNYSGHFIRHVHQVLMSLYHPEGKQFSSSSGLVAQQGKRQANRILPLAD